jgi:hypothetical protein
MHYIENLLGRRTFVAVGEWTSTDQAAFIHGNVDTLWLNEARGFSSESAGFVSVLPNLKHLLIISTRIRDVSCLGAHATLESLQLTLAKKSTGKLDFASMPSLRELFLNTPDSYESVTEAVGLESFYIYGYKGKDLTMFESMPALSSLTVSPARVLESLRGCRNLVELRIGVASRLSSIEEITEATHLERFYLESCKRVRDVSPLAVLTRLRDVGIDDGGEIDSALSLTQLPALRRVSLTGTTKISDGRIRALLEMPSVRVIARTHRDYDANPSEIEAARNA